MINRYLAVLAIALPVTATIYPQISLGASFTSADLLKWSQASQNSFIQTSIGMAGVVASQNRREAARCIDRWYFANKVKQRERNEHIRRVMKQNPSYHPQATILAIVRKACGRIALSH